MRKLVLNLDMLEVESFQTEKSAEDDRGTVHGHVPTQFCPSARCSGEDEVTCHQSCGEGTCGDCSSDCWLTGPDLTRYYIDGACA